MMLIIDLANSGNRFSSEGRWLRIKEVPEAVGHDNIGPMRLTVLNQKLSQNQKCILQLSG